MHADRSRLQEVQTGVKIGQNDCILHSYGGGKITNYGSAKLKISYKEQSTVADFKIVKASDNSSILG